MGNGEKTIINLNDAININSPERVRYLPQNFFERLTNNLDNYDFQKALEEIVFSYLPEEERLGKNSFSDLIEYKKESIEKDIELFNDEIDKINKDLIHLEAKLGPDYLEKLKNELAIKNKEYDEHKKSKPEEIKNPEKDKGALQHNKEISSQITKKNKDREELIKKISVHKQNRINLNQDIEDLNNIYRDFNRLEGEIKTFIAENEEKLKTLKIDINQVFKYELDLSEISKVLNIKKAELKIINEELLNKDDILNQYPTKQHKNLEDSSLVVKLTIINNEIDILKSKLSAPFKKYQDYLDKLNKWENKKKTLEGNEDTAKTINWFKHEIRYVNDDLPMLVNEKRDNRINKTIDIQNKKLELVNIYNKLKSSVDTEIKDYKDIIGDFDINIDVSLKLVTNFITYFLTFINQNKKGSFKEIDDGKNRLEKIISKSEIHTSDGLKKFLETLIENLEYDKREGMKNQRRYINQQVNIENLQHFYNYISTIKYLEPSYELKLGEKHLTELSPGEKGAMLIVFYLMLDPDNIPLIIDQPEENLDNESIYKILVYFIRLTKKKRQVILVTHNPNLAIVGDSEQIIYVNIDKKNKNTFSSQQGSIENPTINKHASDILEGTLDAFDIRRLKYLKIIHT